jgi:trans-2,3-dihydro-3-hydroxyanthranilate isomerase
MNLKFVTVDVFTDRQFGGNPLAVVPDARGLRAAIRVRLQAHRALTESMHRRVFHVVDRDCPVGAGAFRIFPGKAYSPSPSLFMIVS